MHRHFGVFAALFVSASAAYGQTVGANLNTGLGVGASLPGRGGQGGAAGPGAVGPAAAGVSLEQRAAIGVGGRGPGDARSLGPNFNSVRMGAGLGGPGEGSRMGASAAGASGFQMRRDERSGEFRRGDRADHRRSDDRRPEDRPQGERPTSPDGRPTHPSDQADGAQDRPYDPRLLPPLDVRNRAALQADLFLANRLAEIDRLRDVAVSNNDAQMLLRADHLEMEARRHHEMQVRAGAAGGFETRTAASGEGSFVVREFPARAGEHASAQGQAHASDNARPFMQQPIHWPHGAAFAAEGTVQGGTAYGPTQPAPGGGSTEPQPAPPPPASPEYQPTPPSEESFGARPFPARAAAHASAVGQAHASDNARPFMPGPVYLPGPMPFRPTAEGTVQAGFADNAGAPAADGASSPSPPPQPGVESDASRMPRDEFRPRPLFRTPVPQVDARVGAAATAGGRPTAAPVDGPAAEPAAAESPPASP